MQIRFVHSGDSFEEGKTLAEAGRQKLEPTIIEFLEKPTQMPSLRLIRNDFTCLNNGLRPSVPPLEEGLVPFYLLTLVGVIPYYLVGLVLLVVPDGKWPV